MKIIKSKRDVAFLVMCAYSGYNALCDMYVSDYIGAGIYLAMMVLFHILYSNPDIIPAIIDLLFGFGPADDSKRDWPMHDPRKDRKKSKEKDKD